MVSRDHTDTMSSIRINNNWNYQKTANYRSTISLYKTFVLWDFDLIYPLHLIVAGSWISSPHFVVPRQDFALNLLCREFRYQFLEMHQKMNPKKHGFCSGRSCLFQLLEHHNKILEELEKSNNVDVIYLDFAKAFDKVDHDILLNKLKKVGISGKIGVWIHDFLSNRQQCVVVNGTTSSEAQVRSGISQGQC